MLKCFLLKITSNLSMQQKNQKINSFRQTVVIMKDTSLMSCLLVFLSEHKFKYKSTHRLHVNIKILQDKPLEEWTGLCTASILFKVSQPGIEPRSPSLQADSFPEPPGKLKNTGVCSLSLLPGNFLTQESNQGLLQVSIAGGFFTS